MNKNNYNVSLNSNPIVSKLQHLEQNCCVNNFFLSECTIQWYSSIVKSVSCLLPQVATAIQILMTVQVTHVQMVANVQIK